MSIGDSTGLSPFIILLIFIGIILFVGGIGYSIYLAIDSAREKKKIEKANEIKAKYPKEIADKLISAFEDVSASIGNKPHPNYAIQIRHDWYITKKEAGKLGWQGGDLYKYAKGCSIGGGGFGNNEKLLPAKKGRKYFECDIDYNGGKRGEKRLVYSNDGLIYYTEDHYETFELLYGVE